MPDFIAGARDDTFIPREDIKCPYYMPCPFQCLPQSRAVARRAMSALTRARRRRADNVYAAITRRQRATPRFFSNPPSAIFAVRRIFAHRPARTNTSR